MDQQSFERVADTRTLHLSIAHDFDHPVDRRALIDENVANTLVVLQYRDSALLGDGTNKALSPSRDDEVDPLLLL